MPDVDDLWFANGDYTSAQTNTELVAAPATGYKLYVTTLVISNDGSNHITYKLLDGSGGSNLTGTQKLAANDKHIWPTQTWFDLTAATALCLTTTGTSNFSVFVSGHRGR